MRSTFSIDDSECIFGIRFTFTGRTGVRLEGPKTPACRIQGRLEIMAALGNLALWLHVQILVERAF